MNQSRPSQRNCATVESGLHAKYEAYGVKYAEWAKTHSDWDKELNDETKAKAFADAHLK